MSLYIWFVISLRSKRLVSRQLNLYFAGWCYCTQHGMICNIKYTSQDVGSQKRSLYICFVISLRSKRLVPRQLNLYFADWCYCTQHGMICRIKCTSKDGGSQTMSLYLFFVISLRSKSLVLQRLNLYFCGLVVHSTV